MNYEKTGLKIASWSLIIGGAGHFSAELLTIKTLEQTTLVETMEAFTVNTMRTETNIYSFYVGVSLMMGLLIFSHGLLNLLIIKNSKTNSIPSNILLLNTTVTLICALLYYQYFFLFLTTITGLGFLGFSYSLLKTKTT